MTVLDTARGHAEGEQLGAPPSFHLLAKPTGAVCNLDAAADARGGRNEPCTCGSGRKWKRCHGAEVVS